MSRDTEVVISTRTARFSTAAHDEVEVNYPFEGTAGHPENGKKQVAFYPIELYAKRAKRHGRKFYPKPEPFTDGRFKR